MIPKFPITRITGLAMGLAAALALAPAPAHADHGDCGQPQSRGNKPATTDALVVLHDSVGSGPCGEEDDECDCDVNDSGDVTPVDSLIVLRSAVGLATALRCHDGCQAPGTTLPGQTTTTTLDDDDHNGDDEGTSTTLQGGGDDDGSGQDDDGPGGEDDDDGNTLGDD